MVTLYNLVEDRVILELSGVGRATFTVDGKGADIKPKQKVMYACGYSQHDKLQQVFLGYVEAVTPVDKRVQVFCRELSGVMHYTQPLSMRHPDLNEVLAEVTKNTGLEFSVPEKDYAKKKVPHFVNHGSGFHIFSSISTVFEVKDLIWQQQGDGEVYIGAWEDSRYKDLDVDVAQHHFTEQISNKSARMAISPALRPGVVLNGKRVKMVEYVGNFMTVTWV